MSFYNMIHGMSPTVFVVMPMLGHHPDAYPRFRECFTSDDEHPEYDDHIHVYTRTGGENREDYVDQNNWIRSLPGFVADFDDSYDSTFASWVFRIPDKWRGDYEIIKDGRLRDVSEAYRDELYRVFPKLTEHWDAVFLSKTPN